MNQSFIDALMHFFSLLLLPLPGRKMNNLKVKLDEYIFKAGIGFPIEECLNIFNTYSGKYFFEFSNNPYGNEEDTSTIHRRLLLEAGHKSQENLLLQERLLVILSLLEFNLLYNENEEIASNHIKELCLGLNIPESKFDLLKEFLFQKQEETTDCDLIIDDNQPIENLEGEWVNKNMPGKSELEFQFSGRVKGRLHFRLFEDFNYIAFIYSGDNPPLLNDKKVHPNFFYSFRRRDSLRFQNLDPIDFDEIEGYFNPSERLPKIILSGKNISYRYNKTNYSIKPFDFHEESGQLIGVIGNNGVGKSTILKLISSQLPPTTGSLLINGSDLKENSFKLKPVIGYIPQEEISFHNLTIYENLMYNAHLCIGNLTSREINQRVEEIIVKLQLERIRNIKSGDTIGHKISGYQRICIKIAMELIRKPYIIYLDEPLSGLSFSDTKRITSLLREEANKGKLVIMTSQLPNSEVFNMFDKIWLIDQEGYIVYTGEPRKSLSFLRNTGLLPFYFIQSRKEEISAEDVVKIIETKKIQTDGSPSDERQVSPGTWYDAWRSQSGSKTESSKESTENKPIPIQTTNIPNIEKQFIIYLLRNLNLRLKDINYLLLLFTAIPIMGVILCWVLRLSNSGAYLLSKNQFLPLFFFISVNLMFLFGLLTGVEEVFTEKKQLRRELSMNMSLFSYQNSKVVYLFIITFFVSIIYAFLTNLCLEITGMILKHTLIYYSIAVSGCLTGLVLSSGLAKLKTIYILIPFLLLPSLLYTGYLIPFDKTNDFPGNKSTRLPLVAEIVPVRWAYEALIVTYYSGNAYNKYLFNNEKTAYFSEYMVNTTLPVLNEKLLRCNEFKYINKNEDSLSLCLSILSGEFQKLQIHQEIAPFEKENSLNAQSYDTLLYNDIFGYLTYLNFLMESQLLDAEGNERRIIRNLEDSLSDMSVSEYKSLHHNKRISRLVMGNNSRKQIYLAGDILLKEGSNVFMIPENSVGRSHFFASEKRFNNQLIPTYRFNLSVIWLINTLIYSLFLVNILGKIRKIESF